jgi:hypothetical protein
MQHAGRENEERIGNVNRNVSRGESTQDNYMEMGG